MLCRVFRLPAEVHGVDGNPADPHANYATSLPNATVRLWESGAVEITNRFYPIEGGVRIENQRRRIASGTARVRLMWDSGDRIPLQTGDSAMRIGLVG